LLVGAFITSAYLILIRLLAKQPARLDPDAIELLRGLVLAWLAFMRGYVHDLRKRLRYSSTR
jgi:hypothetical protein